MDKLIQQALDNCKIINYHKYFEEVCIEYKRLLDAEKVTPHQQEAGNK